MKNSKSFLMSLTFAFVFACVISCDDQDEKMEVKTEFASNESSGSANSRIGAIELNGTEGDPISLETAKRWAQNYKATLKSQEEHRGHFFGFEIIEQILKEESCVGIRIYYGVDDNGKRQLLLVGVNANGDDLLPLPGGRVDGDGDIVADASLPCPDMCGKGGL